ncbi:MAG: polymer-forming cytoskeletal protein [Betaproteobacteria bacterium]|nr:polymer-forming cytoskeletal protein [Betaproteobacteria bacterium]
MQRKTLAINKSAFDTVVRPGMTIAGNVTFAGDMRVDGNIRGDLNLYKSANGTVVVGRSGRVHGNVTVSNAVVSGSIRGSVNASSVLAVAGSGRVAGNVTYQSLVVKRNGTIHGHLARSAGNPINDPMIDTSFEEC